MLLPWMMALAVGALPPVNDFEPDVDRDGADVTTSPEEGVSDANATTSPEEGTSDVNATTSPEEGASDVNATTSPEEGASDANAELSETSRSEAPIDVSSAEASEHREADGPTESVTTVAGTTGEAFEAIPLEEDPPPATPKVDEGQRTVEVQTEQLGDSTEADAFRHAGSRSILDESEYRGASSVSEALVRVPGVRSIEGIAGVGSTSTKLNVAVRGARPRLSSTATVMLDGVPIAMAPYGQPELALFPLSLFSVERIDAVKGGASVRYGPQTSGGVFNLVSREIPTIPMAVAATQVDQFGRFTGGVGFGTSIGRLGVYLEYSPQVGPSYRDNSDLNAHGGLAKLWYEIHPRVQLSSTTHGYWEHSGIPGGLPQAEFDLDPFSTLRPDDSFDGYRVGEALKLMTQPRDTMSLDLDVYYNYSFRGSRLTNIAESKHFRFNRYYHALGVAPRYTVRLAHKRGPYHELAFGARGAFETAEIGREAIEFYGSDRETDWLIEQDVNGRLAAGAAYAEESFHAFDDRLVVTAGLRGEAIRVSRRDNISQADAIANQTQLQLLPAASIWGSPHESIALFAGYGQSYSPPSFVQVAAADRNAFTPERAHTVEAGVKVSDLAGVWLDVTGWYRYTMDYRDVGIASTDVVGDVHAGGIEAEAGWEPGEVVELLSGTEIYAGVSTLESEIQRSPQGYDGNRLPWYPRVEAWAGASYAFPVPCTFFTGVVVEDDCRALSIGTDFEWSGTQFGDYGNTPVGSVDGAYGPISSYGLWDINLDFRTAFRGGWVLNLSLGLRNVLDTLWYYRTDDVNRGLLAQRPRTLYVKLDVSHYFLRAYERAAERRAQRAERREAKRGHR